MTVLGLRGRRGRTSPERRQHEFYSATAERYDEMHVVPGDEHFTALSFISALIDGFDYRSVLDVGAGTGRGIAHFRARHDDLEVRGVEPVRAMIDQAEHRHKIPAGCITESSGDRLPFADDAFDAVCELGVLHHVADPNSIVAEMARVARRAVFLSDENRFANGDGMRRAVKYGLYRIGLWPLVYRLATGGRPYHLNAGDGGVAYSYSVYDSLAVLDGWADRIFLVPTVPARTGWFHPLFGARNVLLCALRDRD